ncbi:WD40-repeat-containing domain protein [Chytridium lagenaria]|nr:WD40-repeat-containing domain protein [Chytridium lagenaria]
MSKTKVSTIPAVQKLQSVLARGSVRELKGHKDKVHSVGWSCDGNRLASGSVDKTARVYNLDRLGTKEVIELKGHQGDVDQLEWDPTDAERLATASVDKNSRHVIQTPGENINISWSPDGRCIAGNKEDVITFIDPRGGTESRSTGKKGYIWHTMKNDVETFFLTTGQGTIQIYEYPALNLVHTIQAHTANCYCIEFDSKGRYFATGSSDSIVSLWDLEELVCVRTLEDWIAWHPTRFLLAYAGDEQSARGAEGNLSRRVA